MSAAKKIGLFIGREWNWPSAFLAEVNEREAGVSAELVKVGGTLMDSPCNYSVIIDRISHEIPYYRAYLKYAALQGAYIINNPFTLSADTQFFGLALFNKLGMNIPRTVVLPNKRVEGHLTPESFRNLEYPLRWQDIIDYVQVPAILKDIYTGGRRVTYRVNTVDELIERYDESDTLTMVLQEMVQTDIHIHCLVIGREHARPMRYNIQQKSYMPTLDIPATVEAQIKEAAVQVSQVYGYDMNLVEFAVCDDTVYLLNSTNPAPDVDSNLLPPAHFQWSIQQMADFAIQKAQSPSAMPNAEWHQVLSR